MENSQTRDMGYESQKKELEEKMYHSVSHYMAKHLSIRSKELATIILEAFLKSDIATIESLLEPKHVDSLSAMMNPLLSMHRLVAEKCLLAATQDSQGGSGVDSRPCAMDIDSRLTTEPDIDNQKSEDARLSHSADDADDDTFSSRELVIEAVPPGLVPEYRAKEKTAGLKAFVHMLEEELLNEKEETVYDKIDEVKKLLQDNKVVLLQGNTGCGKTTKVPVLLLDSFRNIVCTQPRRLAAINAARWVSRELKCTLGDLVGYAVRFDDKTSKKTRLKFVTDGILLRELASLRSRTAYSHPLIHSMPDEKGSAGADEACELSASVPENRPALTVSNGGSEVTDSDKAKGLGDVAVPYDLVIIDEAHERSLNIDFLMGYFKSQTNTKVLIMSATMNTQKFIDYFSCPCVTIRHKRYPLAFFYLKKKATDYVLSVMMAVIGICKKYDSGDIIVFLTGQEEIETCLAALSVRLSDQDVEILPLYSQMSPDDQERIFEGTRRKVILSTNIAETSITIENIRFVVDCGYVKQMRRSTGSSMDFLEIVRISKAQAKQRAGRAGRTASGTVYRAYTYDEYLEMEDNPVPEIMRTSLHSSILFLKSLDTQDVVNFDYLDRPYLESIKHSLRYLYYLRAIDPRSNITPYGRKIAEMPLEPEMAVTVLRSLELGCFDQVCTIASFLISEPIYVDIPQNRLALKKIKSQFAHPKGTFYSFLAVFEEWKGHGFSNDFLQKNLLKPKVMNQIQKIKTQLMNIVQKSKIGRNAKSRYNTRSAVKSNISSYIPEDDRIEMAFCAGFFMNVAKISEKGYRTIFDGLLCAIHPSDPLAGQYPEYVLFYEILCIRREYMRSCLRVSPKILSDSCNSVFRS